MNIKFKFRKFITVVLLFVNIQIFSQNNFWVETSNFTNSTVSSLVSDLNGVIYAGTNGSGVFKTTDKGQNWLQINNGLTSTNVSCVRINSKGYIFACTQSNGVFRSTNQGENWLHIGLTGRYMKDHSLSFDTYDNIYAALYVIGGGGTPFGYLLRSTDDGTTWADTMLNGYVVSSVNINSNNQIFTIATLGAHIYRSLDGGTSFQALIINNYTDSGNSLTFGLQNEIYFARGSLGIARSLSNGNDWTIVNNGLSPLFIGMIVKNNAGTLYATSYLGGGVFTSTNKGDNWNQLNSGLTDLDVYSIAIDSTGFLYIGTKNGKVFKSQASTTSINEIEGSFPQFNLLEQNFPNPFNPKTKISFYIPSKSYVSLTIFDLIGKEIASLVSTELTQGYYFREWDATYLSSGTYYYQLKVGSFIETRKMILLK